MKEASLWENLSEDMVFEQRKLFKFGKINLKSEEIRNYTLVEIELLLRHYDRSLID